MPEQINPNGSGRVAFDFGSLRTPETTAYDTNSTLGKNYLPSTLDDESGVEAFMNENQGGFHTFANWLAQSTGSAVLSTIEGASYLGDFEQMGEKLAGNEQEYDNWLAKSMREAKEGIKEAAPIYRSEEGQQAFSPGSKSFWTSNSPDVIGSVIGLLIPATVVGRLGKGAAMLAKLGKTGQQISELSGTVAASRYAESTMEANQVFQETYKQNLDAGMNDQEAREYAGQAASRTWNTNWLLAIQDVFQYNTLLKGLKATSKLKGGISLSDLVTQPLSEAAEEGVQYVLSEEAKRSGLNKGKDYFTDGFWGERLRDYVASDEFKASAALGALGGGIFTGVGKLGELKNRQANLNLEAIAKERANYINDIGTSKKIDYNAFAGIALKHVYNNNVQDFKDDLEALSKDPNTDTDVKKEITNQIDDLDFLLDTRASVRATLPKEVQERALADFYDLRLTTRLGKDLEGQVKKLYTELDQTGELPNQLHELKKMKVSVEALSQVNTPEATLMGVQANMQYSQALSSLPNKEEVLKQLVTAKDSELVRLTKQQILNQDKLGKLRNDIAKYSTKEGQEEAKKEAKEQEVVAKAKSQLQDTKVTKEELKKTAEETQTPEVKKQLEDKVVEIEKQEKGINESLTSEAVAEATQKKEPTKYTEGGLPIITGSQINEQLDPDQYELDPSIEPEEVTFDPDSTPLFEGMTFNEVKKVYGEKTAQDLLDKLSLEQHPEPPKQPEVVTESDVEAKERLKTYKTVPAWSKFYEGSWVNDKFVPKLDTTGRPILQKYWDSGTGKQVDATELYETTADGHFIGDTPMVKEGDLVVLEVVDNGKDKQFRYTLNQGFRPDKEDNYVINVYRANEEGRKLSQKPMYQLPSADNKASASEELALLRSKVINAPNQTLITNITSKNIGDPRKAPGMNNIGVLEYDYHLTEAGNWSYGKTPYNPIFVMSDINNKMLAPNVGTMKGTTPVTQEMVDTAIVMPKSKGNVTGGVFTLRLNPEGNLKPVMVYPRNLNEQELTWLRDNLAKMISEHEYTRLNQVYYIPQHPVGVLSTKKGQKIPDVVGLDRRRFHLVQMTDSLSDLLIPIIGKNEEGEDEAAWITVQASGNGAQLAHFLKNETFKFGYINGGGNKHKKYYDSTGGNPESIAKIRKAFDSILTRQDTSRRNITKANLNTEDLYTDPVTGQQYPTYYDFMKNGIVETDLPGSLTKGYGQDSSYSFENARVRLNPNPEATEIVTEEGRETIVREIKEEKPKVEEKKGTEKELTEEDYDRILREQFGLGGESNANSSLPKITPAKEDYGFANTYKTKPQDIISFVKELANGGYFLTGKDGELRIDTGMEPATMRKAVTDIKKGNINSAAAKSLIASIAKMKDAGALNMFEGKGGNYARRSQIRIDTGEKTKLVSGSEWNVITPRELEWFKSTFGEEFLSIAHGVDRIVASNGLEAFGLYHDALVQLAQLGEVGTTYHEAFHFVMDPQLGYLTNSRREKVLREARSLYNKKLSDEALEEVLAEEFRKYMLSNGREKPKSLVIKGFFAELWQAVKRLVGLGPVIERLFSDIASTPISSSVRRRGMIRQAGTKSLNRLGLGEYSGIEKYRLLPGFEGNSNYRNQGEAIQATAHEIMKLAALHADQNKVELLDVLKEPGNIDKYLEAIKDRFAADAIASEKNKTPENIAKYLTYLMMGVITPDNPRTIKFQGKWEDTPAKPGDLQVETGFKTEVLKGMKAFGFSYNTTDKTIYPSVENEDATEDLSQQEVNDLRQEDESERVYDQDHTLRNPNNTLSQRLKLFLSTIEDPYSGKTIVGTPKYIQFNRVMSNLKGRLADAISPITRLAELSERDPISKAVFEALSEAYKKGNNKIVNEFNTGINLALHNFKTVILDYDPELEYVVPRFIDTDRASLNRAIKNRWKEASVAANILEPDGKPIEKNVKPILDELRKFQTKYNEAKAKRSRIQYAQVKEKFISLLKDVGIELPTQVFGEIEALPDNKRNSTIEGWFFGSQSASLEQFLDNAYNDRDPYEGTGGITDILANKAKNYVDDIKGDTFMNEFNDMVNPINLPSYITDLVKKIKDVTEGTRLKSYFTQDKFYENNKFVTLFGSDKAQSIELDFISAMRANEGMPKNFESRTAADSLLTRLVAFYNSGSSNFGSIFVGTFSDKSKQATMTLPKKVGDAAYDFAFEVLSNTAAAEAYRINRIKDNPTFEFPANYKLRGSEFLYIPELNSVSGLTQRLTKGEISPTTAIKNDEESTKAIKKHLEDQYTLFKDYLVQKGLIEIDEKGNYNRGELPAKMFPEGKSLDGVLREFFFNDYAWRIEMSKLFMGDIALYKNTDDYYKRGYQAVTPGTVPTNDPTSPESFVRAIYPKQMKKQTFPKMEQLKRILGEDLAKLYETVNKTDAQSYINSSTYRRLASAWGSWTSNMEDLYQFAWKDGKTINQAIRDKKVDRETGDRYKGLVQTTTIQVLKPFQFNDRELTMPDGSKLLIKEQFKDSMMWLNPELTNRHTELNKLAQFMGKNGIDVMSAADVVKVGSYGTITDFEAIPTENQKRKVDFSDIRFPQMMPDKKKDHISGTQFHKLVVGNLDPKDGRIADYNKLWEEKIKDSSDELRNKLELGEDWQLSNDDQKRADQLFKLKLLLENELSNRSVSDNYTDSLQIIRDELNKPNFLVHLGFPMYGRKFMSILTNLFKKNILQQESPGFAMVNFADYGVNQTEVSSNLELIEDNGALIAEIGMPVDFFREIGLNFRDNVDNDTNKIKWETLTPEQKNSLEFILYRIPTSNKSSMIPVRVAMVVSASSGNVVMLPGELTVQQGLDFDVDKSQLLRRVLKDNKIDKTNVDNKLFELYWSILTEKKNIQEVMTPLDFSTIEAIADKYEARGIISSTSASAMHNAATDTDFEIRNKHGKRMIGIDSRANTAHAVLQTIPNYVNVQASTSIVGPEGYSYDTLGRIYDSEGTLISKNYGELQQSSLDNAKKPIKALMNIFPITDPVELYLTGLGVPLHITFDFLNQPIIREWYKYYDAKGTTDKATKALLQEYPSLKETYNKTGGYTIAEGSLSRTLDKLITDDIENQATILNEFEKLLKVAGTMTKINNVLSVDTFRDMTGIEPLETFMNQVEDVTKEDSPIYLDPSIFNLKIAPKEARRIAAFYKYGVEDAIDFVAQFTPYTTQAYKMVKDSFAQAQGLNKLTDKDTIRKINTFLDYWILESTGKLAPILAQISPDSSTRWLFTDKNKSIWKYLQSMMAAYPRIKDNNLIKNLLTYPSKGDAIQMIGVVNTSSNISRNDMSQGWYDLLHDANPDIKLLGGDLVRFALQTSGLGYNTKSFLDLVPPQYWVNIGLVKGHKQLLDGLRSDLTKIDAEAANRTFIRHKFQELNEVPETYYSITNNKVKTNLVQVKATGTHVESFNFKATDPLITSSRRESAPQFVKLWDKTANKYRLYESNPSNELQYEEVQPLGEPRNYWEVPNNPDGRKKSALKANQDGGVPAPWDQSILPMKGDYERLYDTYLSNLTKITPILETYIPEGKASAKQVVDNLLKQETNTMLIEVLKQMQLNANKLDGVFVQVGSPNENFFEALSTAYFKPTSDNNKKLTGGEIIIHRSVIKDEKQLQWVLTHELLHAYTTGVLANPSTPQELAFTRNIERVLEEARRLYPNKSKEDYTKDYYGLTNKYEFIAELGSNSKFRKMLRKEGLLARIIRYFRNLFGFKEKDKFDDLLDQMYSVLEQTNTLIRGDKDQIFNLEPTKESRKGQKRIDILQQMLSSIDSQIKRLRRQGNKPEADKLKDNYKTLEKLVQANRSQAVVRYLLTVQERMNAMEAAYKTMSKDPAKANPRQIQAMLEQLTSYELLQSFKSQIRKNPLEFAPTEEAGKELLNNIREALEQVQDMEAKVKDLRLDRYAWLVYNESNDPNKSIDKIRDELEVASKDITIWNHWTGGGTEQQDDIVQTNHKALRKAHAQGYRNTQTDLYKKDTSKEEVTFKYLVANTSGTGMHYKTWKGNYNPTGIYKALDDYEAWAKSKGINIDSIVDKFKPVLDMTSFDQGSNGVKLISPASKEGRAILAKPNGDPLKQFYETIVLGYLRSQEKLPLFLRPGLRIPSLQRSFMEVLIAEKGLDKTKAITEDLLGAIRKRYDETDRKAVDEAGNPIKGLPVRFIARQDGQEGRLSPREVSLDIPTTVGLFMNEMHLRNELQPILADLELGKGIAGDREVVKANKRIPGFSGLLTSERTAATLASGKLETIKGDASEAYKKVVQDLEMLAYGEYKKDEGEFKVGKTKFDIGKTVDSFLKLTGFTFLFGKLAIPLTNVMVGKLTQLKEAIGGNIISPENMLAGEKFYATEALQSIADLGQREKKTRFGKFFSFLNPLDTERPVFDLGVSTNYIRTIFEKVVRSGGGTTEFYMGVTALGSVMDREEFQAEDASGKKTTLYEAMDITPDGKPNLKKGYTYQGKKLIDGNDLNKLRDYTLRTYQIMNGIYNRIDSGNIQQYALGRAVMFMRRWLTEGINTRWRTRYFDPRINQENEGHYVSALVGLSNVFGRDGFLQNTLDAIRILTWFGTENDELLLHANELELTQDHKDAIISLRKANIRKTLFELYTIAAFSLLLAFGWDEDDDESYVRYMLARVNRELKTFLSPSTAWDVLRKPTVAMSTAEGVFKIIGDIGSIGVSAITGEDIPVYKQGPYKGDVKLWADTKKQVGLGFLEQFSNLDVQAELVQRGFR